MIFQAWSRPHAATRLFVSITMAAALCLSSGANAQDDMAPPEEQVLRLVTVNMPRSLDPTNIDAQRLSTTDSPSRYSTSLSMAPR